jgi:MOSC domain-containing protein YiiM
MMKAGVVVSIHTAPEAHAPMISVDAVRAVPGRRLEGDRYFDGTGTFSANIPGPDHEVTLIEVEAMDALKRDYGVQWPPGEARRNIVTRGVAINHLVGREFVVGEVMLRGIRLCEPCSHLAKLTSQRTFRGLIHRGGLRAQILTGGIIRVGDVVREP